MKRTLLLLSVLSGCANEVGSDPRGFDASLDAAPDAPVTTGLVINEVAADGSPDDWIEVYNGTASSIDLSVYSFGDDLAAPELAAYFAGQTFLAPGEYRVQFLNDAYPGFKLGADEELGIYDGDGVLVDSVNWNDGDSLAGTSFARIPDAIGGFRTTATTTRGFPNEYSSLPSP